MSQSLIQLIQHRLRPDPVARFHRIKFIPADFKEETGRRTEEKRREEKS